MLAHSVGLMPSSWAVGIGWSSSDAQMSGFTRGFSGIRPSEAAVWQSLSSSDWEASCGLWLSPELSLKSPEYDNVLILYVFVFYQKKKIEDCMEPVTAQKAYHAYP